MAMGMVTAIALSLANPLRLRLRPKRALGGIVFKERRGQWQQAWSQGRAQNTRGSIIKLAYWRLLGLSPAVQLLILKPDAMR
jgi:hypothetical protein